MPLRRFAVIGAALLAEDGVLDVTTAPRNDAAAVDIGSRSWPFDIRLGPWVFRPHIGLLPWRYIASGDVRPVATNRLESGRFQGFLLVLTGNMSDQVIAVRCANFFGPMSLNGSTATKRSAVVCRTRPLYIMATGKRRVNESTPQQSLEHIPVGTPAARGKVSET